MNLAASDYRTVLAIDSQVVLETKPLEDLPWGELGEQPILLLVCRQVITEIDSKKSDGRLGERSRKFNAVLERFLESGTPVRLCDGITIVDVALITHSVIDWRVLDSLDRDEPDDKIVAQILHAKVDGGPPIKVLSHDLRVRDAARLHGLEHCKLPDHWLREKALSPDEKRLRALQEEVRILRTEQPMLAISFQAISLLPFKSYRVGEPSDENRLAIQKIITRKYPYRDQRGNDPFGLTSMDRDYGYDDQYRKWKQRLNEKDIPTSHLGIARHLNQVRVQIEVQNSGSVPAEGLVIEARSGNSLLYTKPYGSLPFGPPAPYPRPFSHIANISRHFQLNPAMRDPLLTYVDESGPANTIAWSCASFRQEKVLLAEISVELLGRSSPKLALEVVLTASNLRGDFRRKELFPVEDSELSYEDAVDFNDALVRIEPQYNFDDVLRDEDIMLIRNDGSVYKPG